MKEIRKEDVEWRHCLYSML